MYCILNHTECPELKKYGCISTAAPGVQGLVLEAMPDDVIFEETERIDDVIVCKFNGYKELTKPVVKTRKPKAVNDKTGIFYLVSQLWYGNEEEEKEHLKLLSVLHEHLDDYNIVFRVGNTFNKDKDKDITKKMSGAGAKSYITVSFNACPDNAIRLMSESTLDINGTKRTACVFPLMMDKYILNDGVPIMQCDASNDVVYCGYIPEPNREDLAFFAKQLAHILQTAEMDKTKTDISFITKSAGSIIENTIREAKDKITTLKREIDNLNLDLQQRWNTYQYYYFASEISKDDMINKLKQQFEKVMQLEEVEACHSIDDILYIVTKPIVYAGSDKKSYLFGSYTIMLNFRNKTVRFINNDLHVTQGGSYRHHPHVFEANGEACLGNIRDDIGNMMIRGELLVLVATVVNFVSSVNEADSAGKTYIQFPVIDGKKLKYNPSLVKIDNDFIFTELGLEPEVVR
jgi:hypothetical protein